MAADQKMARINVDDETWTRLRMHALQVNRSVADYLGELVRDVVRGAASAPATLAAPAPAQPRDRKPQRAVPATSMWVPPWEI